MHWKSISLILWSLSLIDADPLTQQENAVRLATCGKSMTSKVYKGAEVSNSKAPWSVFVNIVTARTGDVTSLNICTGTIVSPRHILTATHCFADLHNQTGWSTLKLGTKADENCDKDKNYVIKDAKILEDVYFTLGDKKQDSQIVTIAKSPEKITLLSACAVHTIPAGESANNIYEDFTIIDLYEDMDLGSLQQTCLATSLNDNRPGVPLDYYGYGNNYPTTDVLTDPQPLPKTTGILRHESIITRPTNLIKHFFYAGDPNYATVACQGDSGGGAIGKINGRNTIIGVLSQTSCSVPGQRIGNASQEMYESVGFYADTICKLTGMCDTVERHNNYFMGYEKIEKPSRIMTTQPSLSGRELENSLANRREYDPDSASDKLNSIFFAMFAMLWMIKLFS